MFSLPLLRSLSSIVKTRAALQKVYSHWHDEEVRKAAATVAIGPELDQGAKIVQFKRRKRL
jgi:hypothetical protein